MLGTPQVRSRPCPRPQDLGGSCVLQAGEGEGVSDWRRRSWQSCSLGLIEGSVIHWFLHSGQVYWSFSVSQTLLTDGDQG